MNMHKTPQFTLQPTTHKPINTSLKSHRCHFRTESLKNETLT